MILDVVTLLLMSVTGALLTEREENFRQVERLIQSNILHGSESLCKLLRYLAEQTTDRVQTGRLRSKLSEYYGAAGADDPVVIEIPKGSYSVQFHRRSSVLAET